MASVRGSAFCSIVGQDRCLVSGDLAAIFD